MEQQNENKLDHSQIEKLTLEIIQLKKETENNIIEIGKKLKQVKLSLPHGHFLLFLEKKVDFTRQTANKFMKIADEFANNKSPLHLGTEKLYLLTTIPKKDREQFMGYHDVEGMSTRELKQTIKDMKNGHKKVTDKPKININTNIPIGDKTPTEPPIDNIKDNDNTLEELQEQRKNIIEKRLELLKENTKKYQEINNKINNLEDKKGLYDQIGFAIEYKELLVNTQSFLQTNLAPFMYSRALKHLDNPDVAQNILGTIKYVDEWSREIKDKFPMQYKKGMKFVDVDTFTDDEPKKDIWKDTVELYNQIMLRSGEFYNNNTIDLGDKESLLLVRYIAGEITFEELKETIEQNKLNIPFLFDEELYKERIEAIELSTAYDHYVDDYNSKTKEDNSYTYYDILKTKELNYDYVVGKSYATEQGETEETRQEWIEKDEYLFRDDNITVDWGCDDCLDYICVYQDKELLGHYNIKKVDYYNCIEKLFDYYKIDKKYLSLVDKFKEQLEKNELAQKKKLFTDTLKGAKFKYIEKGETYIVQKFNDGTDYIVIFKGYDKVASFLFPRGINVYSNNFYDIVLEEKYIKELIEEASKNKVDLDYIFKFHKKLLAKAKKVHDEFNPFKDYKENYKFNWDNFNFDDFKFKSTTEEVSLKMFDNEELKFLKDMLKDKDLWKKCYRTTAIKNHPDRAVTKGTDAVKKAEDQMKLLNSINDKIKKCC